MNGSTGRTVEEVLAKEKARAAQESVEAEAARQAETIPVSAGNVRRTVELLDPRKLEAEAEKRRAAEARSAEAVARTLAENAANEERLRVERYGAQLRRLAEYLAPVLEVALAGEGDPTVTTEHKMAACEWLLQQFEIANERIGNARAFARPPAAPLVHTKCHEPVEGAFVVWLVSDPKDTSAQIIPVTLDRRHYKLIPGPCYLKPDIADTTPLDQLVENGHVRLYAPGARVPEMSADEHRARRHAIAALGLEVHAE